LAKALQRNPRELAAQIADAFAGDEVFEKPEIAGPGFVNFRVTTAALTRRLTELIDDEDRIGVSPTPTPQTIVVDFSAPNVAKPMHIGHIRGTIIGDCLTRVAAFLGHRVISDNHIGD